LLQNQLSGAVKVVTGGVGFTVVQDLEQNDTQAGGITAYDAAGTAEATLTDVDVSCGAADVVLPTGRRVLLALTHAYSPAQGVNPATQSTTLHEYAATDGDELWAAQLTSGTTDASADPGPGVCNSSTGGGALPGFSATADGNYAVETLAPSGQVWVIDLTTGAKRASRTAEAALGGVVVDDKLSDGSVVGATFSDPRTGRTVATPSNIADPKDFSNGATYATESTLVMALNPGGSEYSIRSIRLPSATVNWTTGQTPYQVSDVSVTGQTVIGWNHFEDATGVLGYDLNTGHKLWAVGNSQFCAAANGKAVVSVNGQLAVLDARTGKQLSFDPSTGSCPNVLSNGVRWSYGSDGTLSVDQYL